MIAWWQDLCQKVTEDPEWIQFFSDKSIVVHNITTEEFTQQVKNDIESHLQIMKDADIVDASYGG
jgi:tripartite-type tricarboxylate transporter receptor subunit TctC